jgi:dihydropteroate synthase
LVISLNLKNKEEGIMYTLNLKGRVLAVSKPMVMGILNATPDSFYAGSRVSGPRTLLEMAGEMVQEGADILDLGGQSTRPGSERLSAEREAERVVPLMAELRKAFPALILSIDTYHASVAAAAVEAGADMINDISGGRLDPEMLALAADSKLPYVCMHMQGTPADMQQNPQYQHIITDILDYFSERIKACRIAGIHDVIIDPGFGFGKTIAQNFELLRGLEAFKVLGLPVMVGLSRKSSIYRTLGVSADESLNGTTVLHTIALQKGAAILRVHDVREARETIQLVDAVYQR